jgi:hypothetical protein
MSNQNLLLTILYALVWVLLCGWCVVIGGQRGVWRHLPLCAGGAVLWVGTLGLVTPLPDPAKGILFVGFLIELWWIGQHSPEVKPVQASYASEIENAFDFEQVTE